MLEYKNDGDSSEATTPSPGPRIGIVEFFNKSEAEKCKDFLEQNSHHTIRLTAVIFKFFNVLSKFFAQRKEN